MKLERLSFTTICILVGTGLLLTAADLLAVLYLATESIAAVLCGAAITAAAVLWGAVFAILIRKKVAGFSSDVCQLLDEMLQGNAEPPKADGEETLLAKISHRIARLYDILRESRRQISEEKASLQELISDISHQVKTPVANLKMVNATLLEQQVPEEKQREFLLAAGGQLDKLDFLMQAMIKTSRLEAGAITLEKKDQCIYDTLAAALGGILLSAEKKHLDVSVSCPEDIFVSHDRKWTAEALFNILDNAVKYTQEGGRISVTAESWEMYVKIDVADTGRGISERVLPEIFKRFYREKEVHEIEGIGIGLYLARQIISRQGGYIKVNSKPGKGSIFSVFLPNR